MGTLDIKNFPAHGVSDEDTFLMTDAKNGFVAGSMTLKDMKEKVITPLVKALSLDYELLTQAEYDAIGKKKGRDIVCYRGRRETGKDIYRLVAPDGGRHAGKFG